MNEVYEVEVRDENSQIDTVAVTIPDLEFAKAHALEMLDDYYGQPIEWREVRDSASKLLLAIGGYNAGPHQRGNVRVWRREVLGS